LDHTWLGSSIGIAAGHCGTKSGVMSPPFVAPQELLDGNLGGWQSPAQVVAMPHLPGRNRVSAVIPALNEAENLPYVLSRMPSWLHEVILVDGGSRDGTADVARRLWPTVRIVEQDGKGKGAALRSGIAAATGDIIVMLDADGSTDPAEIPAFVGALLGGADFAKGTRFIQGAGTDDMPLMRRLGNWAFVTLANVLFGVSFSDITYGYNAFWRQHRHLLALEINGWPQEIISNLRVAMAGLRVVEVASFERLRLSGQAKLKTFSAGCAILSAIFAERLRHIPPSVDWPNEESAREAVLSRLPG
jgi:glycosyltransferase involved in cell wall biosynthesis